MRRLYDSAKIGDSRIHTGVTATPQAENAAEEARETIIWRNFDSVNLLHPDPTHLRTALILNQQPVRKTSQDVSLFNR